MCSSPTFDSFSFPSRFPLSQSCLNIPFRLPKNTLCKLPPLPCFSSSSHLPRQTVALAIFHSSFSFFHHKALFDANLQPACPAQLTSPVLHATLAHASLQPLVWGGKGVGSQGDGSAQFLCKGPEEQVNAAARELRNTSVDVLIEEYPSALI